MQTTEWLYGIHAINELINRRPADIQELLFQQERQDKRIQELQHKATSLGIPWQTVARKTLEKRLGINSTGPDADKAPVHQGVAALCWQPDFARHEKELKPLLDSLDHAPLLLVLDAITDPHNLGACLRTADAAGVDAVIVPKDNSAPLNMTVRKVASGAAETVKLYTVTNLSRTLAQLKERGIWVVGAAGEASQGLHSLDLTLPTAIVMGSEGKGMRRLTREHCDYLAAIPMAGALSSLNVSVATGVMLYEAVRQRQALKGL
ncbi:MAG: 23S rRNA (guanosine(2251)-2'-O)-methyltransferase RlmB [Pseudomonadales bacterium]|nr:23S rRNA (guanosine(2251)-2'-O)-methyltransferase RlmB [Pseudomonadales bacterium]